MALAGEDITFEETKKAVEHLVREPLKKPFVFDTDVIEGYVVSVSFGNIPINVATTNYGTTVGARHICDVIPNWEGEIPKELLVNLAHQNKFGEAPAPFNLKAPCQIPYKVAIFVIPQNDGKKTIFKHIEFDSKVKPAIFRPVCHGTPHAISWAKMGQNMGHDALKFHTGPGTGMRPKQ